MFSCSEVDKPIEALKKKRRKSPVLELFNRLSLPHKTLNISQKLLRYGFDTFTIIFLFFNKNKR